MQQLLLAEHILGLLFADADETPVLIQNILNRYNRTPAVLLGEKSHAFDKLIVPDIIKPVFADDGDRCLCKNVRKLFSESPFLRLTALGIFGKNDASFSSSGSGLSSLAQT